MKKVLIVTYYWPPAGGVSVQRVTQFAKYLPENGWMPIILTVEDGNYHTFDTSLARELEHIAQVHHAKSFEPHQSKAKSKTKVSRVPSKSRISTFLSRALDFIRLNVFIPDSRIGWYPFAVKKGLEVLENESVDVIFSTAPPYTPHLVARTLSNKTRIPWVADFRDPWLENTMYNTSYRFPWVRAFTAFLERRVLSDAGKIVCTGWSLAELYQSKVSQDLRDKFEVITNGYSRQVFGTGGCSDKFVIMYFGSLYRQRCYVAFFKKLGQMLKENNGFANSTEVHFVGDIDSFSRQVIDEHLPSEKLNIHGFKGQEEADRLLAAADLCLMMIDDVPSRHTIILGKLYDYISLGKPVLGLGPETGDSARLLSEFGRGKVIDGERIVEQQAYLEEQFFAWQNGDVKMQAWQAPEALSRKRLTQDLAAVMNRLVEMRQ